MKRILIAASIPAILIVTSGCSLNWASMSPVLPPTHKVASKSDEKPVLRVVKGTTLKAIPYRRPSALETGSVTHKRDSSGLSVLIDYWTKQPIKTWHGQPAQVNLSLHAHYATNADCKVEITQVKVVADHKTTLLQDIGQFIVSDPFSYGSAFTTPYTTSKTMQIGLQVDLLIETEPDSGVFFRQTVFDAINLTFPEGTQ